MLKGALSLARESLKMALASRPRSPVQDMSTKRIRQGHRIVRYEHCGKSKIGVELGDGGDIVDLRAVDPSLPEEMWLFMRLGAYALGKIDE